MGSRYDWSEALKWATDEIVDLVLSGATEIRLIPTEITEDGEVFYEFHVSKVSSNRL